LVGHGVLGSKLQETIQNGLALDKAGFLEVLDLLGSHLRLELVVLSIFALGFCGSSFRVHLWATISLRDIAVHRLVDEALTVVDTLIWRVLFLKSILSMDSLFSRFCVVILIVFELCELSQKLFDRHLALRLIEGCRHLDDLISCVHLSLKLGFLLHSLILRMQKLRLYIGVLTWKHLALRNRANKLLEEFYKFFKILFGG
jgi:hypothetical protein